MNGDKIKTSIEIPKQLWKDFQKRCIDDELSNTKGFEIALRNWLIVRARHGGSTKQDDSLVTPSVSDAQILHGHRGGDQAALDLESRARQLEKDAEALKLRTAASGLSIGRSQKSSKGLRRKSERHPGEAVDGSGD